MRKSKIYTPNHLALTLVMALTRFNLVNYTKPGPIEFALADFIENSTTLRKDLQKIPADWENAIFTEDKIIAHTTPKGIAYISAFHGGDWELPVYFVIYLDHTGKLRAYVPEKGNTYSVSTKAAYGNEDAKDAQIANWASYGLDEDEFNSEQLAELDNRSEFDRAAFEVDIDNRIQLV